jgi:hypothetical protein
MEETEETLVDLIERLLEARAQLEGLPEIPEIPAKKPVYTISEWNAYMDKVSEIKTLKSKRHNEKTTLEYRIQDAEYQIKRIIPEFHTWFITDDGKYAVAVQRDNWGGSNYKILIRKDPDPIALAQDAVSEIYYN